MKNGDIVKIKGEHIDFPTVTKLQDKVGVVRLEKFGQTGLYDGVVVKGVDFYPNKHSEHFWNLNKTLPTDTGYLIPESCLEVVGKETIIPEHIQRHESNVKFLNDYDFSCVSLEKSEKIVATILKGLWT